MESKWTIKENLKENFNKACCAEVPDNLMFQDKLEKELEYVREYLCKILNEPISEDLNKKIKEAYFSSKEAFKIGGFDEWFERRIKFYQNEWEEMTKYTGEIVNKYNFLSETFKILNRCSWWVQNGYQPFSGSDKDLLNELDYIAAFFEQDNQNKEILKQKANNLCASDDKNWKGITQRETNFKERERERQISSFFAELKAANELLEKKFCSILFLEEGKNKMPDIYAQKEELDYYIEVKRIQSPKDEDEALRSKGVYCGNINKNFASPLKKKILDFIKDAVEKFRQKNKFLKNEQKILILDFEPGIDARSYIKNRTPELDTVFRKEFFKNLEKEYSITIWRRGYFN